MRSHDPGKAPDRKEPDRLGRPTTTTAGPATAGPLFPTAPLALQRGAGNAAVVQMLRQAGHLPAQAPQRHQHSAGCGHEQPKSAPVQRSAVNDVLTGSGKPLDAPVRQEMEARLGADFSGVRLHTGSAAQRSAAEIGARAYTSGNNIVIGQNGSDKHTLAHELTHVIQQRQGPVAGTDNGTGLKVSDPTDRYERAAEANARQAMTSAYDPSVGSRAARSSVGHASIVRPSVQRTHRTEGKPVYPEVKTTSDPRTMTANVQAHEEYPTYWSLMSNAGFKKDVINDSWQILLGGLSAQPALNGQAEEIDGTLSEKRAVRNENSWYIDFAKYMEPHLKIEAANLALWSGGIGASLYARTQNCTPLEDTKIGRIVHQLVLHEVWANKGPFWNNISKMFVDQLRKNASAVHVYMRTDDSQSVLQSQELPHIEAINTARALNKQTQITVVWHALYTVGPQGDPNYGIKEIAPDGSLVDSHVYTSHTDCAKALEKGHAQNGVPPRQG
ncbi:eCIS core domain-containing protein [Streptomyces anulatus]|uniref:eCIS core domain-containing protein n=1 Tax=Streptomyces anulatus TaxID=1892 RepID=UPI003445C39E